MSLCFQNFFTFVDYLEIFCKLQLGNGFVTGFVTGFVHFSPLFFFSFFFVLCFQLIYHLLFLHFLHSLSKQMENVVPEMREADVLFAQHKCWTKRISGMNSSKKISEKMIHFFPSENEFHLRHNKTASLFHNTILARIKVGSTKKVKHFQTTKH